MRQTQTIEELQEEMATVLAEKIQKEIDEEVLLNILVEGGWTKISYNFTDIVKTVDMMEYCHQTFKKNQWQKLSGHFVFRKKQDAEWFILRWS